MNKDKYVFAQLVAFLDNYIKINFRNTNILPVM